MSDPSFVPLHTGDTQDDDAHVIDSLVETVSAPPTPVVEPINPIDLPVPLAPNNLLSVTQTVNPGWLEPTLIMPENTSRVSLVIMVNSPTSVVTDGICIRSANGPRDGQAVLLHGQTLTLDGYTGAVRVFAIGNAPVVVNVWSVNK